ncbi:MAG: ABC transporter permease, partial [Acidobacteria bacterium]|nr:ABC transporter permease [Acidobacteriota bacterium]
DLNGSGTAPGWLSALSPIGWAQKMRAFGENQWWPLLALLGGAAVLCAAALWIESRRDLGSGLLAERAGSAVATRLMTTPLGLALRLQRGSICGWFAIMIAMAILYGSVASAMANLLGSNPLFMAAFGTKGSSVLDGVLGLLLLLNAMVASAFALESVLQVRAEEASGRAESQLAGSISRLHWAGAKLLLSVLASGLLLAVGGLTLGLAYGAAKSDLSELWPLLGAAMLYLPGVLVTAGVAVFLIGVAPRVAATLSWAYLALLIVISGFGEIFNLPTAVISHTPLTATPRLPAEALSVGPLLILTSIAVLLWGFGLRRFSTRDIAQGA